MTACNEKLSPVGVDKKLVVNTSVYTHQGYESCMFYIEAPTDKHYMIQLNFTKLFGFTGYWQLEKQRTDNPQGSHPKLQVDQHLDSHVTSTSASEKSRKSEWVEEEEKEDGDEMWDGGPNGGPQGGPTPSLPPGANTFLPPALPDCLPRIDIVEVTSTSLTPLPAPSPPPEGVSIVPVGGATPTAATEGSEGVRRGTEGIMNTICQNYNTPKVFQSNSQVVKLIFTWPQGDSSSGFELTFDFQKMGG